MKGLESQEQDLFYKSITKNAVNFLTQETVATDFKQKALKVDGNLLSQLFISCQSRQCDLNEFFMYETSQFLHLWVTTESYISARNLTLLIYFNLKFDTRHRTRNRGHRCWWISHVKLSSTQHINNIWWIYQNNYHSTCASTHRKVQENRHCLWRLSTIQLEAWNKSETRNRSKETRDRN